MDIRELSIPGCFEVTPKQFHDSRGTFLETYRFDELEQATGRSIDLKQVNTSVSSRGTIRGIHFADLPGGQAKYVFVPYGAVIDYAVDIRVGSPTFGEWDCSRLDAVNRKALFLPEGIGHCFVALTDNATVSYLVTDVYRPEREHGITPLDRDIALDIPFELEDLRLSEKDSKASSLSRAREEGALPTWDAAQHQYAIAAQGHKEVR